MRLKGLGVPMLPFDRPGSESLANAAEGGRLLGWLRGHALALLLAVALPGAILASLISFRIALDHSTQAVNGRQDEAARILQLAVDARLDRVVAAATTLALSPQLQGGGTPEDVASFARLAGLGVGARLVALLDLERGGPPLLIDTQAPGAAGRVLATLNPVAVRAREEMLRTRQTVISDVYVSRLLNAPVLVVFAPVLDDVPGPGFGAVRGAVEMIIPTAVFVELIRDMAAPEGSVRGLYDARGYTVACSVDGLYPAGQPGPRAGQPFYLGHDGVVELDSPGTAIPTRYVFRALRFDPAWHVSVFARVGLGRALILGPLREGLMVGASVPLLLLAALLVLWRNARRAGRAVDGLDAILSTVPAAVWVDDISRAGVRTRRYLSDRCGAVLGYSRQEVRALGDERVRGFDAEAAFGFAAFQRGVFATGEGTVQLLARHRDGRMRLLRYDERCAARWADGGMRVTGSVIDVTEEVEAAERRHHLERLAVLGEVAVGIAHEMNQPLAAISMATQNADRALAKSPPDLARVANKLSTIRRQIERIAKVIDHTRSFGRRELTGEGAFDVAEVIGDALVLIGGRLRAQGVMTQTSVAQGLPPVNGVGVMLEQVMVNLLANAMDAYRGRPDIGDRRVEIRAEAGVGQVVITIADRAGGIPDSVLPRLFDAFFTTKPSGEGTGLGLSISMATVREMGGTLAVCNRDGGARFEIVLPALTTHPPA